MITTKKWGVPGFVAAATIAALALVGCSTSAQEESGSASEGIVPEGIPTMEELYAGVGEEPPATAPAAAEGKSVWWLSCSEAVSGCSTPTVSAAEAAQALGYDFHVVDGKLNEGGAFSDGIRTAIAAGADAIVMFGADCTDAQQAAQEAKDAEIPIMSAEGIDCVDSAGQPFPWIMEYSNEVADTDEFWREYGRISANYIVRESDGNVKLIATLGDGKVGALVKEGFLEVFDQCETCELVGKVGYVDADMTPNGPWIQTLRSTLVQHPEATAVYFPFDFMVQSLGGLQAVEEAGLDAISFGGQGVPEVTSVVREGRFEAITSARAPGWAGYAAMDNINRILNGQETVPQGLTYTVVDAENGLPAEGESYQGPMDWKAAYEKSWAEAAG